MRSVCAVGANPLAVALAGSSFWWLEVVVGQVKREVVVLPRARAGAEIKMAVERS